MQDPSNPNDSWQQVPNTHDATTPPPNYPPQPPPVYPQPAEGLSPTTAAALAYLTFIPAIVFLVLEPYKRIPFVRFHAIQSIVLNVIWMLVWIVLGVVFTPLLFVGAWTTIHLISEIVRLAFFIAWLVAIIQAAQGKWFKLPVIGDFSLRQAQK